MTQTALVTGANKGIGFAIAEALASRGVKVYLGARNLALGEAAASKLHEKGYDVTLVKVDLNAVESNDFEGLSEIDFLVNNAGIAGNLKSEKSELDMGKSVFDYTHADLQETLDTNFLGTHDVILAMLPHLTADAKILNITVPVSQSYWMPLAYITSKAALNAMTFAFGHQFKKDGSKRTIFGVMPGAIATDLNGATAGNFVKTPAEAAKGIVAYLFDGKNHNATLINLDGGLVVETYEPGLGFN
ncbi:MAG: SDR family NAD(P)-dependent oxidoreductase [Streptococcaceae bacterium]|jgi:NAD(P)-dependent dehydrogenase (short-subunit alcohol dehydrogenase family)|nr:SDR family NAD(P)-dependent oxidoreductase [Streptococcaceae bacterium]